MREASWVARLPRRVSYTLAGALLALGAPLGLLAWRSLLAGTASFAWATEQLHGDLATYAYVGATTTVAFALFGRRLGTLGDALALTSATDGLTALANRRQFDERLAEEVQRAGRHATPFSLLLVDVDGLKKINDHGGHEAGDAALRAVARGLRETCRRTDTAARVGGDEFAVLAPMTTSEHALELANRIRAALASAPGAPTVSIGIADLGSAPSPVPEAVYATADRALYAAKSAGRDRAVVAPRAGAGAPLSD